MGSIPAGLDATLVLVRHGESQLIVEGRFQGRSETPLSDLGRRQAAAVAARLADPTRSPALPVPLGRPTEIVHSPLGRAAETAGAIALAMGDAVPRRADPGFVEIGQGDWEGLHLDEIATRFADELSAWRRSPHEHWAPGGESLAEVRDRVEPALRTMFADIAIDAEASTVDPVPGYGHPGGSGPWSILVGHDGVFKVTLLTLFDLPIERFWMWSFELCGITVVDIRAGRAVLRAHNLVDHLAPLHDERARVERAQREATGAL